MDKGKMNSVTILITVIILLLVFVFIAYAAFNRDRPQIVLPDENAASGLLQSDDGGESGNTVTKVEINPETVQRAIATLQRPEAYSRTLTITTYWSGGSGAVTVDTYAVAGYMRMDMSLPSGQTRHMIRTAGQAYVWYNSETSVFSGALGAFSEDEEQWIPTYEDLLQLEPERIAAASYEPYQEIDCIYAETTADEADYVERYWVSVESGLLVAAERLQDDAVVYRMEALTVTVGTPSAAHFTLPDGTVLYSAQE